ncbi:PucR family transcriptional regulator [Actinomadura sediminis]|uniref:PucR family transcriptional regulator n=1 Tax=Actinomadura sediminis TaxID=1038904 RepID=A0ABW3ENG7_9ACTN
MEITQQGAALDERLRSHVPEVAAEVTVRIRRDVPALGRARYLDSFVESLIEDFLGLLAGSGPPSDEILARARDAGAREAAAGRGPDVLPAAARLGAGIAIARLTEHAGRLGVRVEIGAVGRTAQQVFAYVDRITAAVAEGHGGSPGRAVGEAEERRRELLDLLLSTDPGTPEIRTAALSAGWRLPRTVAVIALSAAGPRPMLPPDVLLGLHRDEPCLVLPDPEGLTRRRQVAAGLRGRTAAVGPTVEVPDAARSLRWARRTLSLVKDGGIAAAGGRPVRAVDHLPRLMTSWGAELVDLVAADRLAPLDSVRPSLRRELEVTLLALLECHFRAVAAAARLHVHPQTVRYRLRKLEALFGEALYEPRNQLDMHLLLHARTAGRPDPGKAG